MPDHLLEHTLGDRIVPLPRLERYILDDAWRLLTPALLVYPDLVTANIRATLRRMNGDPDRWRAHVKTAKLASVVRQLVAEGVTHLKCATTLELLVACESGARDVLLAYPAVGPKVERAKAIARDHPHVAVSALVESAEAVPQWTGSTIDLFIDLNPGMNRTGISDTDAGEILDVARAIDDASLRFAGLHYYDGHIASVRVENAEETAHRGYDRLIALVEALESAGIQVPEVITAGTPALPFSLSYPGFANRSFVHRVSPGTVVYSDVGTTAELSGHRAEPHSVPPKRKGPRKDGQAADSAYLVPAAIVAATVVSHPAPGLVTCDAGHKTVSADAGVPTCQVAGRPDLQPLKPSEEHLPIAVPPGSAVPPIGTILYLVPRHVCPTVNNFDHAVIVSGGRIAGVEPVAARGREAPLVE